jgi:ABC-type Mn2+/Zn2+ transport system ATPase subunit
MTNPPPFVSLKSAAFGYDRQSPPIVDHITFAASAGDFIVLRGPNGCGKSTVIKGMLGLAHTLGGTVQWSIDRFTAGYVPQETSVGDNIPYTALDIVRCAGVTVSRHAAGAALESIGMADKCNDRFGDLSGGQKRRVLLARALSKKPQLLILDEPTANVDQHTESIIETVINDLTSRHHATVIAVAHAADFGKNARVIHIENGRLHE